MGFTVYSLGFRVSIWGSGSGDETLRLPRKETRFEQFSELCSCFLLRAWGAASHPQQETLTHSNKNGVGKTENAPTPSAKTDPPSHTRKFRIFLLRAAAEITHSHSGLRPGREQTQPKGKKTGSRTGLGRGPEDGRNHCRTLNHPQTMNPR